MGGANNCTTCKNPTLDDLAVLSISATINSLFISLKEVFCGVCIEKGARSFVGED